MDDDPDAQLVQVLPLSPMPGALPAPHIEHCTLPASITSPVVHAAQVLVAVVQNIPVVEVQSDIPHWQSVLAALVVAPLVMKQVAGGRFVQVLVEDTQ